MNLRGIPNIRRSTKILFLSFIFTTFILYIKFKNNVTENESNVLIEDQNLIEKNITSSANQLKGAQRFKQYIDSDIAKQLKGLGDNGQAAALTDAASKEIGENQMKKIALNEILSEHISYNRSLQDARNPLCQSQHFNLNELPTTSIIVIFYNVIYLVISYCQYVYYSYLTALFTTQEPYSVLLRTVHSIFNTVEHQLLKVDIFTFTF